MIDDELDYLVYFSLYIFYEVVLGKLKTIDDTICFNQGHNLRELSWMKKGGYPLSRSAIIQHK